MISVCSYLQKLKLFSPQSRYTKVVEVRLSGCVAPRPAHLTVV